MSRWQQQHSGYLLPTNPDPHSIWFDAKGSIVDNRNIIEGNIARLLSFSFAHPGSGAIHRSSFKKYGLEEASKSTQKKGYIDHFFLILKIGQKSPIIASKPK
jgi:hypothetical protein